MRESDESFLTFIKDRSLDIKDYRINLLSHRDFFTSKIVEVKRLGTKHERGTILSELNPTIEVLNREITNLKNQEYVVELGKKCKSLQPDC